MSDSSDRASSASMAAASRRLDVMAQQVAPSESRQLDAMLARNPTASTTTTTSGVTLNPPLLPPASPPALGRDPNFPSATTAALFPPAAHDALDLAGLLSPRELAVRERTREFMVKEVAPIITPYWERAEFPFELLPKLARLDLNGANLPREHGGQGLSVMECAMACFEMARVDASVATFHLVHNFLALLTVGMLGSDAHRRELVPRMRSLDAVGCWALSEPSNGSDAAALSTTATPLPNGGGWRLDGTKRWIGNAPFADVLVIWARNTSTGAVNAFVVRKGNPGLRVGKIQNKTALRCVQNGDIVLDGCVVPDSDRLPGVNGFGDTNKVLAVSRVMVAWLPVGMAAGAYDMAVRYTRERRQFGAPLAAFQLVQERLARMQGQVQAMWLVCWRLTKLLDEGRMTHEQASLAKAWTTAKGREAIALARETLGGNGVVVDFLTAKAHADIEAIYTYEGTYDVNVLVAGRGITGVAAIKPAFSGKGGKH